MKFGLKILSLLVSIFVLFTALTFVQAEETQTNPAIYKLSCTLTESFDSSDLSSVTTITENGIENKVCAITSKNADGSVTVKKDVTLTDSVYEAGFRIKTENGASSSSQVLMQLGYSTSYPIMDARLKCDGGGNITSIYFNYLKETYTFPDGLWKDNEWNDIRFKVTDDKINQTFAIDTYINATYVCTADYDYNANHKADTSRVGFPCSWRIYKTSDFTGTSYVDDVFIARYTPVESFVQDEINAEVTASGKVILPETVTVFVNGVSESACVIWGKPDEDGNVSGLFKDYGVDCKATATAQGILRSYFQDFDLQTEDGVRHPYAVNEGFTGYACAKITKKGNSPEEYSLIIAQYDENNRLAGVNWEKIDTSQMSEGETKEFRVPLTYKSDGGSVKGFIMDKNTIMPQGEAVIYREPDFFPDSIFDEIITYTDATKVLNADGEYYEDYSTHDENYDIDAIFYDSVIGEQTKVFAYVGIPKGASEENPVPAVVCIHGGGGVAYDAWVKKWNDNGYAAIAMTLSGDGPRATTRSGEDPTPYKGLDCWGNGAFLAENASMYQNVINVIRAHNLIRQLPCVDEYKTGITGISWGGVTTTTVIGVDQRFRFAIPVYGCGYLDLDETYFADYIKTKSSSLMWDPANFAAKSTMPVLYINGDSDGSFSLNCTSLTAGVTPDARMLVINNFSHAHSSGRAPQEIYAFADGVLNGSNPFITVDSSEVENGLVTVNYTAPSDVNIDEATLYYITDEKLPFDGEFDWEKVEEYSDNGSEVVFTLPEGATHCYAMFKDNNKNRISTKLMIVK